MYGVPRGTSLIAYRDNCRGISLYLCRHPATRLLHCRCRGGPTSAHSSVKTHAEHHSLRFGFGSGSQSVIRRGVSLSDRHTFTSACSKINPIHSL